MSESFTRPRIKIFVDYWNFQLLLNGVAGRDKVSINWKDLGEWLSKEAASISKLDQYSYEGTNIYTSYNPQKDASYFDWVQKWLNRQPGIQVYCQERQRRQPPSCPSCHRTIAECPYCHSSMVSSGEKGVDTLIVTDMIRLAWENAYDMAVLASSDRDLIPAVKYLDQKGKKVVHAGFREIGSDLARSSWASFDISPKIAEIIRK